MPLYVYACDACEIEVEVLHAIDRAADFVECPICHGLCERAIPAFTIGRSTAAPAAPPVYGRVPASYHAADCACCTPRR